MDSFETRTSRVGSLGYLAIFLPPAIMWLGCKFGIYVSLPLAFFLVFPLFRLYIGDVMEEPIVWSDRSIALMNGIPRAFACLFPVFLVWAAQECLRLRGASAGRQLAFGASLWLVCSLATSPVHALVHSRSLWDRRLASSLAALVGYPILPAEHMLHHASARSAADYESPGVGDSLLAFVAFRYFSAQFRGLRWASMVRLRTGSKNVLDHPGIFILFTGAVLVGFYFYAGLLGMLAYGAMIVFVPVGVGLTGYLQHWGLGHEDLPELGPQVHVAWEDRCQFQAWLLLGLSLHQRHHELPSAPYYRLTPARSCPTLPYSYSVMLFVALVPSVWRRVMGQVLAKWRSGVGEDERPDEPRLCYAPRRR